MKNTLWTAPPRPQNPNAEQERIERESDTALLEIARNYKPSSEMLVELRKYDRHLPKEALHVMVQVTPSHLVGAFAPKLREKKLYDY